MKQHEFVNISFRSYIETLLWSSGEEYDSYSIDDIEDGDRFEHHQQVGDFIRQNWNDVRNLDPVQVGHDFALTRNGHGAGFWDRGLGELGDRLTQACKECYGGVMVSECEGEIWLE